MLLFLNKLIKDVEDFKILIKSLNSEEIQRLCNEYPKLLKLKPNDKIHRKKESEVKIFPPITSLAMVKNDINIINHVKLKKIKLYIDESNDSIIKILRN